MTGICATLTRNWIAAVVLAGAVLLCGCSTTGVNWPWQDSSRETKDAKPAAVYHDFKDVRVPAELEVVDDATYIVESGGYKTGVLTLKGPVEKRSLVAFFNNSMTRDGWRRVASFRTPERSILLFGKGRKWCVINVMDYTMNTEVEIGVVPTDNSGTSGAADGGDDAMIDESGLLK
jgi:hypothetical protein